MSQIPPTPSRYPFGLPFGWFAVAEADQLAVGQATAAFYFDRHLVVWRDQDGVAHVNDAFCPHLGAHLGHGATVEGTELMCPFHGWRFDAEGTNTDIPYSDRTNRRARLGRYPTREALGFVYAWYHPDGAAPTYELRDVDDLAGGDYRGPKRTEHVVHAGIQEMAENAVDSAHFRYVHNVAEVPEIETYETDGHIATMRSRQRFPTPRGVVDGRIDTESDGPGVGIVRFSGIVDTLLISASTPVDANTTHTRFHFYVRSLGDEAATSGVGDAFAAEVDRQFAEDTPIWEHKAHLVRPALADNDGPFMTFRRWYRQFYAETETPVDGPERGVFPPPYWPDKLNDSPAKATASARHGG